MLLAAVYGVPDAEAGDRLMAAVQLAPGRVFDPDEFATFLDEQRDLGPKWVPTYVRIVPEFPMTETNKVLKRVLVRQRWETPDPVWWRAGPELTYVPFTADDLAALRKRFAAHGRGHVID